MQPYIIATMFTPDMRAYADRLRASLDAHGLEHALREVPTVHRAISTKGSDDLEYSKPSFILRMLDEFARPVLYLDADLVVRQYPIMIAELVQNDVQFASYNWLGDEEATDAYTPVVYDPNQPARYLATSHSIDFYDPRQLINSGAVLYLGKIAHC